MNKKLLICLALQFLFFAFAFSQKAWEKYAGNPVLELGPTGSWDALSAQMGTVLFDGTNYHIWYSGFDGVYYRIGHATSQDGISWTKDPFNPVLDVGPLGSWDESAVYIPTVLLNGTTYHMWYDGAWGNIERVGHATSTDGSDWTKDPLNPVLDIGSTGSWEDYQVFPMAGSVIFEDNTYKMWYGGGNTSWVWNIGYASSTDGCTWTKEPSNPVMGVGNAGEWDDYGVIPATVLPNEAGYQMWFSGCNIENRWRVGYATSPDGLVWTKYPCNPVLNYGSAGSWDHYQAWNASVLYDDIEQQYKMWYTGGDYYAGRLGYAISPSFNIFHVPCDYLTIQEGIDAANDGDVVLVYPGTYYENITFRGKAITVASLFYNDGDTNHINNTIIDGSTPIYPDTASVVRFVSGEDTTSVLMGFTITGGAGTIFPPFYDRIGGGVCLKESGGKIIHNKIIGNIIDHDKFGGGGGIGCTNMYEDLWLVVGHNIIKQNAVTTKYSSMGGGIVAGTSSRIFGNIISDNELFTTAEGYASEGGGIYCEEQGNPDEVFIFDNIISNNSLSGDWNRGGGIHFLNSKGNISNNQIFNNKTLGERASASAICFLYISGDVLIQNNDIYNNHHMVDAMANAVIVMRNVLNPDVSLEILNNDIHGNTNDADDAWSAPIWLWDLQSKEVLIDGNHIYENTGGRAGGFYARDSYNYRLTNNVFENNYSSEYGGVMYFHQYNPSQVTTRSLIANNNFLGNHAGYYGGVIYFSSTYDSIAPVIMNNIFWENNSSSGRDIYYWGSEELPIYANNIDTNMIVGNWEGDGNINNDPLFCDDSCHLNCFMPSPCINYGVSELEIDGITYYAPDFDMDGESRPLDDIYDIGADEEAICIGITENTVEHDGLNLSVLPNPSNGIFKIRYSLAMSTNVSIQVIGSTGDLIESHRNSYSSQGNHSEVLNLSHLPDGIYLLRLLAGDAVETAKVVLRK